MVNKVSVAVTVAVVITVALTAHIAISEVAGEDFQEYMGDSEEWCEERNGTLVNSRVIGPHGGLHCNLPSGESVHMSEVIEYGE